MGLKYKMEIKMLDFNVKKKHVGMMRVKLKRTLTDKGK